MIFKTYLYNYSYRKIERKKSKIKKSQQKYNKITKFF